jgi:hypothetical protein
MKRIFFLGTSSALILFGLLDAAPDAAPQLQIQWPLRRKAYQTNEWIDLAVVRSSAASLPEGDLILKLSSEEGSQLSFTFRARAVPAEGNEARATEHLHLNGRLLRPGNYTLEASIGGVTAKSAFELYSHIRQSSFRLVDWSSRAKGEEQLVLGEKSMGFNTLYASYGGLSADDTIRAGMDYMWCCTMGGAHQMDIRMECDWSDPYVLGGGTARVVRRAFMDRTHPNCIGVHFYDEPGLTWHKHPATGEFTPHNIPAQDRAFKAAFGREPLQYNQVKAENPEHVKQWMQWGRWKEAFMEAAWRHAAFGVSWAKPDFLSANQSVYGWSAFTDGYYFNITRALPLINGHGGYDDYGGAYFNPSFTHEFGRIRDLNKPNWYLPTWYGNIPANRFRMEQYLSFMTNLQGMMKPPDIQVHHPSDCPAAEGVVESNKLMARHGTIFTTMPVTRPEVAVLYSLSQNLAAQTKDMSDNYEGGKHARTKTLLIYLASKQAHIPVFPIVEEDVLDGTLAAHHKAVVLPGIDYLDPNVVTALEAYIAGGGTVWLTDESKVQVKGATKLGAAADTSFFDKIAQLWKEQKMEEIAKVNTAGNILEAAAPISKAFKAQCDKLAINPVIVCDNPNIAVSRQALGDIEYLFAVNASYDAGVGGLNAIKPATAHLTLAPDGRPIYDAVDGGQAAPFESAKVSRLGAAIYRFGPGQMRVFARTARPIGSVHNSMPIVRVDYTNEAEPIGLEVGAVIADIQGRVITGAAPLQIRVFDPLGRMRFDLFRALDRGILKLNLPLAVNDPAGEWKVTVRELLANHEDTATFQFHPLRQCGAVAGATQRAVYFGNDRENIYRFFRLHKDITIVKGSAPYHAAMAERLAQSLQPWGVQAKIVNAADVKPREITAEEAKTWCGLEPSKVQPGKGNNPVHVGYDVRGAVVLLGTPDDNPLVAFLNQTHFLPYTPHKTDFPGRGRGYLAWQLDGMGYGQESIALIAYDAPGMAEAVGTLYEAATGLEPAMKWILPVANTITPAKQALPRVAELSAAWQLVLPDRAVAVKAVGNGRFIVLSQDGTLWSLNAQGKVEWHQPMDGGETWTMDAAPDGGLIVVGASQHVTAFYGSGKPAFGAKTADTLPLPAATFVAVAADGSHVAVGGSDGSLSMLDNGGKRMWSVGGIPPGDKKTQPNPYLLGSFAPDGRTLSASTHNETHAISVADGKITQRGPRDTKAGDKFKIVGRVAKHVLPRNHVTAVIYWGGLIRIVDANGTVKAEHALLQDVAAAAWNGGELIIADADGRVFGLTAR